MFCRHSLNFLKPVTSSHRLTAETLRFVELTFFSEGPFGIADKRARKLQVQFLTRFAVAALQRTANSVATFTI